MPLLYAGRLPRRFARSFSILMLAAALTLVCKPAGAEEQLDQAVRWSWQIEPAAGAAEAELVVTAELAPDWVVYSSDFKADLGPQPVRLTLPKDSSAGLLGPLRSIDARRKHDTTFNAEYGYFSKRVELRQHVRLPADGSPLVAILRGQACYEADGTCHLIRQEIRIALR